MRSDASSEQRSEPVHAVLWGPAAALGRARRDSSIYWEIDPVDSSSGFQSSGMWPGYGWLYILGRRPLRQGPGLNPPLSFTRTSCVATRSFRLSWASFFTALSSCWSFSSGFQSSGMWPGYGWLYILGRRPLRQGPGLKPPFSFTRSSCGLLGVSDLFFLLRFTIGPSVIRDN